MAERMGMVMKLPALQPRSRLAHEAAHWARTHGRFDDYHAEIFRAFFERGEDIGEPEVLTALARTLGLPGEALLQALRNRTFEQSVVNDERDAAMMGINGVPAFVADRKAALSGVQPVQGLRQLIADARSRSG